MLNISHIESEPMILVELTAIEVDAIRVIRKFKTPEEKKMILDVLRRIWDAKNIT